MHFILVCAIFSGIFQVTLGWVVTLDRAADAHRGWQVKGEFYYLPEGYLLKSMKSHLPSDFRLEPFAEAEGLWLILPDEDNKGSPLSTNVTFYFIASHKLMDSLRIKYALKGPGSRILFRRTSDDEVPFYSISEPLITESKPYATYYQWINLDIPFTKANSFHVEVVTKEKGDFVLIDKIEGSFVTLPLRPFNATGSGHHRRKQHGHEIKAEEQKSRAHELKVPSIILQIFLVLYYFK